MAQTATTTSLAFSDEILSRALQTERFSERVNQRLYAEDKGWSDLHIYSSGLGFHRLRLSTVCVLQCARQSSMYRRGRTNQLRVEFNGNRVALKACEFFFVRKPRRSSAIVLAARRCLFSVGFLGRRLVPLVSRTHRIAMTTSRWCSGDFDRDSLRLESWDFLSVAERRIGGEEYVELIVDLKTAQCLHSLAVFC